MNLFRRIAALLRRSRLDRDVDLEMRTHLERETEQNIERGMSPEESRYAARRAFGGVDQLKERERDARGFTWLESIGKDLRYALRGLRRDPGFTTVAVVSLAFAIGATTGVFTIVKELFLRPAIALRADEVVNVFTGREAADRTYRAFSFPEFSLLHESDELFVDVAAFRPVTVGLGEKDTGKMRRKFGFVVSETYFSLFGVKPGLGRFFLPDETHPGAGIPVAVVSASLWEALGGGGDITRRTVSLNGETWTIVGVAPKGFSGGMALVGPDIWLPMGMASRVNEAFGEGRDRRAFTDPANFALHIVGRLRPELTIESAQARLPAVAARLSAIAADADKGSRTLEIQNPSRFAISTEPASDETLLVFNLLLLGMSAVVLLVACLNLANMFLARGATRTRELTVRLALGASRSRVVRLLFVEGVVVALLGGAAGLFLSHVANSLLLGSLMSSSAFSSLGFGLVFDAAPDARVLLATLSFCLLATLVFSIGPALHVTRKDAGRGLSLAGSERTATERWGRLFSGRHCLLMAQIALSLALLFSAGLFYRAAQSAARLDPGFDPHGDLVAELDYTLLGRDETNVRAVVASMADALREHPATREVALASHLPFGGTTSGIDLTAVDESPTAKPRRSGGRTTAVSAGYFDTIGVRLLRGRDFTELEWRHPGGPQVVIIDERMAAALFPGVDPIGRYLRRSTRPEEAPSEAMEIIGVVSAHWDKVFSDGPPRRVFFPLAKRFSWRVFVHVRGQSADAVSSAAFTDDVRKELLAADGTAPLVQLMPYPAILDANMELWSVRFAAALFGAFGLIALLLAVVGVYGVKAFIVARRTREFGIRIALGAGPRQVFQLLLKQGAAQVAIGLTAGLLLALATGQLLASMLLRVSPSDPLVLVGAALPLAVTALLACWLPARRAAQADPMAALRAE